MFADNVADDADLQNHNNPNYKIRTHEQIKYYYVSKVGVTNKFFKRLHSDARWAQMSPVKLSWAQLRLV